MKNNLIRGMIMSVIIWTAVGTHDTSDGLIKASLRPVPIYPKLPVILSPG